MNNAQDAFDIEALVGHGVEQDRAEQLVDPIRRAFEHDDSLAAWSELSRKILRPDDPLDLHRALHSALLKAWDTGRGPAPVLEVRNLGPVLPEAMADKLFESMVSIREGNGSGDPHLGLGLYIVRLIAEAHGARASARNLAGDEGVVMAIAFPERPGGASR